MIETAEENVILDFIEDLRLNGAEFAENG